MNFTLRFNLAHKMTDPWTRYAFWFQFSPIKQFSTWCRNVPGSLWICVISFCLVGKKKHEWQGHDWFRLHTTSFEKAKRAFYYTNHEATHRKTVQFSLTQTLHWNFSISKVSHSQSLHRIVSAAVRYLAWCVPAVVSSFHPLLMTISLSDPSCYRRSLHCT